MINNIENILAIELLAGCQALEFFHANGFTTTEPLEALFTVVRKQIAPWKKDRYMSPDIEKAASLISTNKIWNTVKPFVLNYNQKKNVHEKLSSMFD